MTFFFSPESNGRRLCPTGQVSAGPSSEMADTVSVVAEGGDQFAKMFYSSLDTNRQDLKHLYHDESKVVWNGQPLLGREKVSAFLIELPPSRHELSSLDCQPVAVPGSCDT